MDRRVVELVLKRCLGHRPGETLLVVTDDDMSKAIEAILKAGKTGHPGDGRIFVSEVKAAYTIRTGKPDD